jgi:shikimate kinase / 3-dehydroquinate synthase
MATGKTTVGRILAGRLATSFADADAAIEERFGVPISEVFARQGEVAFREVERRVCRELADAGGVVAVGGGAVVDPEDRAALARRATLVCLDADPATLAPRLGGRTGRPLADDGGWRALLARRSPAYDDVALHVATDGLTPEAVTDRVQERLAEPEAVAHRMPVPAPDGEYGLLVGPGLLTGAGALLREHGLAPGRALIVTDAVVSAHHAPPLLESLAAAGWEVAVVHVPPGEPAKSLPELGRLYDACAAHQLGRDGLVLGLGGGAVGDLAGFAAATWLRGVAYVALPTTLLAMVDAAIGGKTGVNLGAGKNLAGTFTSPRLVLADVATLTTLPAAEWRAGLAEVVKHALIAGGDLLERLESDPPATPPVGVAEDLADLVARAASVKVGVVAEDFRERGRREVLNLGHTFAHAFEHASRWRVRHGEAVSVGLVAACVAAAEMGLAEPALTGRVESLLRALGLPLRLDLDPDPVLAAMAHDKKRRAGRLRLVLPERPGSVVVRTAPEEAVLRRVLGHVLREGSGVPGRSTEGQ